MSADRPHKCTVMQEVLLKYVITVRPLTENDLSRDCPYGDFDLDDYEFHLQSLASDIENLDEVNSVSDPNNQICVDTALSKQELLEKMKPFFIREFCYVRYLSIESCA